MYWSERCCVCIPLEAGGLLGGTITLLLSCAMCVGVWVGGASSWLQQEEQAGRQAEHRRVGALAVSAGALAGALGLLASVLLLVGIQKRRAGLVLCHFTWSVVVTLAGLIATLLTLLQHCFLAAGALLLVTGVLLYWTVVVHYLYERVSRGWCGVGGDLPHLPLHEDTVGDD